MSDGREIQPASRTSFSFPAQPDSIGEVRHLVIAEASTLPFSPDDLDDIALAISEAFTNIVQYAPGYRIRGACITTPTQLEVRFEVEHNISRFLGQRQFPTGLSHSGRGIPLLNLLVPTVEVTETPNGTWELRLIKPVTQDKEAL